MQNMVRKIILIFFVVISVCSCEELILDWTPIMIYNVKFEPDTVKIGDEITITYLYSDPNGRLDYNNVSIDSDGNIKDKFIIHDEPMITNDFVSFGTDVTSDTYTIEIEKGIEKFFCHQDWEKIHPEKYTSFKKNEVKCIVPPNAKSGNIYLYMVGRMSGYGYSLNKLTVLDSEGNVIK